MEKKYLSLSKLSLFLDNLKNTFAPLSHKHTLDDVTNYKIDTQLSSTSTNPVQNKVVDAEFEAVSAAMNALEAAIDDINLEIPVQATAPEEGELWVDTSESGEAITPSSIGAYSKTEVNNLITTHNTNTSAHNDIRTAVTNAQTTATAAQTAANSKVPLTRTVNGKALTSDITLTASDIGLGNVNNTADSAKSVKYATSAGTLTGLTATVTELNYTDGVTSNIQTQLNDKLSKSGGTLTDNLAVPSKTDYTASKVRNIQASTTDLTAGTSTLASGNIYIVYE